MHGMHIYDAFPPFSHFIHLALWPTSHERIASFLILSLIFSYPSSLPACKLPSVSHPVHLPGALSRWYRVSGAHAAGMAADHLSIAFDYRPASVLGVRPAWLLRAGMVSSGGISLSRQLSACRAAAGMGRRH